MLSIKRKLVSDLLNPAQLYELTELLAKELSAGKLEELVASYNRGGKLEEFLSWLGLENLLNGSLIYNPRAHGKIVVIGQTSTQIKNLIGVAKEMGFSKDRFEFVADYNEAKTFKFNKLINQDKYALILVGPMPHSTSCKGDFSSIISCMEQTDGYPPVLRLGGPDLKITKTGFRECLEKSIESNLVAA